MPQRSGAAAAAPKPRASSSHQPHQPDNNNLTERLASALKSLRPGSHHHHNAHKHKSMVVDADDVVYFPSFEQRQSRNRSYVDIPGSNSHSCRNECANSDDLADYANGELSLRPTRPPAQLKTLDDLRQLYRCVLPDEFDETERPRHRRAPQPPTVQTHYAAAPPPTAHSSASPPPSCSTPHSLSPRSPAAAASLTSSLASTASSGSARSAADSGYRSHQRFQSKKDSKTSEEPNDAMRSVVYVDEKSDDKQPANVINNNVRKSREPNLDNDRNKAKKNGTSNVDGTEKAMSGKKIIKDDDNNLTEAKITVVQVSNAVSHAAQCDTSSVVRPKPYRVAFAYTIGDIRRLFQESAPALAAQLTDQTFSLLLSRFRHSLELFSTELKRNVGPFVKCAVRDVNLTLMSLLPEKTAYVCMDYAVQTLSFFSKSASFSKGLDARASLKLSVGKMFRWIRLSGLSPVVVDVNAVYLTAVFERLLLSYVQQADKGKGARTLLELVQQAASLFAIFPRTSIVPGVCLRHADDLDRLLAQPAAAAAAPVLRKWSKKWAESWKLGVRFGRDAKDALFFFARCADTAAGCTCASRRPSLDDWMDAILNLAEHRNTRQINRQDVLEAARALKAVAQLPARASADFLDTPERPEWALLDQPRLFEAADGGAELKRILNACDSSHTNANGLSCLSRCILARNAEAARLLAQHAPANQLDTPVAPAHLRGPHKNCKLFDDFLGWTPLCWAVAVEDEPLVQQLLARRAQPNAGWMRRETPLQLAAAVGNETIVRHLLKSGADLHFSSIAYERREKSHVAGAAGALALAAALGHAGVFHQLLEEARRGGAAAEAAEASPVRAGQPAVAGAPRPAGTQTAGVGALHRRAQHSLAEALYYAVEAGQLDLAADLSALGVRWTAHSAARCLRWAVQQRSGAALRMLLDGFGAPQLGEAPLVSLEEFVAMLFEVVELDFSEPFADDATFSDLLALISHVFQRFGSDTADETQSSASNAAPQKPSGCLIDPKYCDNEKFSDVRFRVDDRLIYGHRIALVNASAQFESVLQGGTEEVRVRDISYNVFKAIIEFVYGKREDALDHIGQEPMEEQLKAVNAAERYGLAELSDLVVRQISDNIDIDTCLAVYRHAIRADHRGLLAVAEPFILGRLEELAGRARAARPHLARLHAQHAALRQLREHALRQLRHLFHQPEEAAVVHKL